jgi:hypothetical protein
MKEFLLACCTYLLSAAISAAAGVAGGVWYARHQERPPPVVVLDMKKLVEHVAADAGLDDSERQRRILNIGLRATQTIDDYAARGVIVLDGSAVLRAPNSAYVGH